MIHGNWLTIRSCNLLCLLFLISCSKKQSDQIKEKFAETPMIQKEWQFPEDWLGYWEGELSIYNENGLSQTLPMALDNQATDTTGWYVWAIIYGEDTIKGRRNYYLKEIDAAKGHYQTDERNSIFLDSYLFGNTLASAFEVQGNYLTTNYTRTSKGMTFEIFMMRDKQGVMSGGMEADSLAGQSAIPPVESYPVAVRQVAYLKRR